MRTFICRWPNGDCSLVMARNRGEAVEKLDEVANAEACPIVELPDAQVHLALTDDGQLALVGLGEDTEAALFEFCYPLLNDALASGQDVTEAVRLERDRVKEGTDAAYAPATELGRGAKAQLDMPTTIIDRAVARTTRRHLRAFRSKTKPS